MHASANGLTPSPPWPGQRAVLRQQTRCFVIFRDGGSCWWGSSTRATLLTVRSSKHSNSRFMISKGNMGLRPPNLLLASRCMMSMNKGHVRGASSTVPSCSVTSTVSTIIFHRLVSLRIHQKTMGASRRYVQCGCMRGMVSRTTCAAPRQSCPHARRFRR